LLGQYLGAQLTEAALKMADIVEGTRLVEVGRFPAFAFQNIYILPGVPQLFVSKLEALRPELRGTPRVVHRVFVEAFESAIADDLERVEREHPPVKVGSYPRIDVTDHKVMVTVEAEDRALVDGALAHLLALLPAAVVVRVERG
jgi:molybdopterin-biosynthesis enzyme MoeA-like protein